MKRQIKFRGKSFVTGEWLYGDLLQCGFHIHICDHTKTIEADFDFMQSEVDPATIGQFTGLTDRNGTEIYEGDIITVKDKYPRVIVWDKVSWAIMPCEHYHDKDWWVMNLQHPGKDWWEEFAEEIEVVGNIHDNPIED